MRHGGGRLIREPRAHTHGFLRKILALDPHYPVAGQTDRLIGHAMIW
jgi:hypothetical protein